MSNHYWRASCRACGSKELYKFLDLGQTPLADSFVSEDQLKNELYFPLSIHVCESCNHMQLRDVVDPRLLFPEEYALFSSAGPAIVRHFNNYAEDINEKFGKIENKFVVEIASNDGVLLVPMKELGFKVLGIEPTLNTAAVARSRGIDVVTEFFTEEFSLNFPEQYGHAGIVSANNVLAHVDEPLGFLKGVKNILDLKGVFIFEVQYGLELIKHTEFDNIYHEHLSFFALRPLNLLMKNAGLKIFNIQSVPTQGGSLRCYATHAESTVYLTSAIVAEMEKNEIDAGLDKLETYKDFGVRALAAKTNLLDIIKEIKRSGKRIVAYGAPAKGNTLLNFCGIGPDLIEYCIEKTAFKCGKLTPGMHIPVVSDEVIRKDGHPDFYLLLIWNYLNSILANEGDYVQAGGKFIIPIPNTRII